MDLKIPDMSEALEQYLAAAGEFNSKTPGMVSSAVVKNTATRLMMVLLAYGLPENWTLDGKPRVPLPGDLTTDIAYCLLRIVSGHIPQWMLHCQRTGAPRTHPKSGDDIGLAIAYKKLCESRLIDNRAPTKTIAKMYGVTGEAVRKWAREYSYVEASDFAPYAKDGADRARLIAEELPKAGERYRSNGRGLTNPTLPRRTATRRAKARRLPPE